MKKPEEKTLDGVCPFVSSPSEDCYCIKMNSVKIKDVAEFCMGKYFECNHHKKLAEKPWKGIPKTHEPNGSSDYDDADGS